MRNTAAKLVHVDNSKTPSLAINNVSSNGELHPQRWLRSRLTATSSTTPTTERECKPTTALVVEGTSFLPPRLKQQPSTSATPFHFQ